VSSTLNRTRIAIIGHPSADLEGVAATIPDSFLVSIAYDTELSYEFAEFAAVVLAVSAHQGAPSTLMKAWDEICEFQIPRAILITEIESPEADFDEAVLIVRRMFGEGVSPFLVLHSDDGSPCAFIDLETMEIRDYSLGALRLIASDNDHRVVVQEFRNEYLAEIAGLDEPRFATGLFVPILPFSAELHLGGNELVTYLHQVVER
jgi:hypothetical protein